MLALATIAGCGQPKPAEPETKAAIDGSVDDALALLERMLEAPALRVTGDEDRAITAAQRLGEIGAPAAKALPALERLANDNRREARRVAQEAISKIKGLPPSEIIQ
jgi:hypothetical protein